MIMNKEIAILKDINTFLDDYIGMFGTDYNRKQLRRLERGFTKFSSDLQGYKIPAKLDEAEYVSQEHKESISNYFNILYKYIDAIIDDIKTLRAGFSHFSQGTDKYIEDMKLIQSNNNSTISTCKDISIGYKQITDGLRKNPNLIHLVKQELNNQKS